MALVFYPLVTKGVSKCLASDSGFGVLSSGSGDDYCIVFDRPSNVDDFDIAICEVFLDGY